MWNTQNDRHTSASLRGEISGLLDMGQLIAFMEKFGAEKGMLVTREKTGEENGITTVTLWQFLLRDNY